MSAVRPPPPDGKRASVYYAGGGHSCTCIRSADGCKREDPVALLNDYFSPRTQKNRKFVDAGRYLNSFQVHPQGHLVAVATRGKVFTMGNWEGPVLQHGDLDGVRYRLPCWLKDNNRVVVVSDAEGEETLEIHFRDGSSEPQRLTGLDIGRVIEMDMSPKTDTVALVNHRNELIVIDLEKKKPKVLDKSELSMIYGFDWSPDGRWIRVRLRADAAHVADQDGQRRQRPHSHHHAPGAAGRRAVVRSGRQVFVLPVVPRIRPGLRQHAF